MSWSQVASRVNNNSSTLSPLTPTAPLTLDLNSPSTHSPACPHPQHPEQKQNAEQRQHKSATFSLSDTPKDSVASPGFNATRVPSKAYNLNETDNIKVAVRVRPLLPFEKEKGATSVLNVTKDHSTVEVVVPGPSGSKLRRDFQFHACLGPETTQSEVLQLCGVQQMLDAALAGYNVTIFAYGMTGSGKTYTMSGREEVICQDGYKGDTKDGIVTQSVNYLYRQIKERKDASYTLSASYLEIYNEGVYDLLPASPASAQAPGHAPHPSTAASMHNGRTVRRDAGVGSGEGKAGLGSAMDTGMVEGGSGKQAHGPASLVGGKPTTAAAGMAFKPGSMPPAPAKPGTAAPVARDLCIKWEASRGFHVPGLQVIQCDTIKDMLKVIHSGMQHRHVGSHELNIESSRSHSLMTIHCHALPSDPGAWDQGTARCGKICFVDLAGSERLKDSKSEGTMLKETTNINKSLFVLGKVISALADKNNAGNAHVPYRDSKLTKLLMDSLGGSALALMVACCSPSSAHVEETLSTLSYATRAKNIQNRPTIQYDPDEAQAATYRREIGLLRQENGYLREQLQEWQSGYAPPPTLPGLPPLTPPYGHTDHGSVASSVVGVPPYRLRPPLPTPPLSIATLRNPALIPTASSSFTASMGGSSGGEEGGAAGAHRGGLKAASPQPGHVRALEGGSDRAALSGLLSPSKEKLLGAGVQPSLPSAPQLTPLWQQQQQQQLAPASAHPLHTQHLQRQQLILTGSANGVRGSGEGLPGSGPPSILAHGMGGSRLGAGVSSGLAQAGMSLRSSSMDNMLRHSRERVGEELACGGAGWAEGPHGAQGPMVLPAPRPGSGAAWHYPSPLLPPQHPGSAGGGSARSSSHPGSSDSSQPDLGGGSNARPPPLPPGMGSSGGGGARFRGSRPSSRGGGVDLLDGQNDELMRRLQETQALLARFSEEHSLLARENDRLNQNRLCLGAEHAEVLGEIVSLREQLAGLECAVKGGHAQPGAVKALLGTLRHGTVGDAGGRTHPQHLPRGSPYASPSASLDMAARSSTGSCSFGALACVAPPLHPLLAVPSGGGTPSPSRIMTPGQPTQPGRYSPHYQQQQQQQQQWHSSGDTSLAGPQQPQMQTQPQAPLHPLDVHTPLPSTHSPTLLGSNPLQYIKGNGQQQQQPPCTDGSVAGSAAAAAAGQAQQAQQPRPQAQSAHPHTPQQQQPQHQHGQQSPQNLQQQQQQQPQSSASWSFPGGSDADSAAPELPSPLPLQPPLLAPGPAPDMHSRLGSALLVLQQQQQQQQPLLFHTQNGSSRLETALTQPPPPPPPPLTGPAAPKPGDKLVVADPSKLALLFG